MKKGTIILIVIIVVIIIIYVVMSRPKTVVVAPVATPTNPLTSILNGLGIKFS